MDPIAEALLKHGVLGLMCALLLVWIYYKDKQHLTEGKELRKSHNDEITGLREELSAEQKGRVEDAKAFTSTALSLQEKAIETVTEVRGIIQEYGTLGDTVSELVAVLKKRNGGDHGNG